MKTVLKITLVLFFSISLNAQSEYEKGMQTAFDTWQKYKPEEASKQFESIANKEKDNWLPYYYVALVNISNTFYSSDRSKIPTQLENAKRNIVVSKKLSPNNVENIVLEALILTSEMIQNTAKNSNELAPKIEALYQKALAISPENPRVVAGYADWQYNSALYLKQDVTPYCDALKKALVLLKNEKEAYKFAPRWGRERVEMLLKNCE